MKVNLQNYVKAKFIQCRYTKKIKLQGPFEFTLEKIKSVVPSNSTGNFLLGYTNFLDKEFNVLYVGYAKDLRTELKKHLHSFAHFKFASAKSLHKAYVNDCMLYHTIKEKMFLMNERHPVPPKGEKWSCPMCGRNGLE